MYTAFKNPTIDALINNFDKSRPISIIVAGYRIKIYHIMLYRRIIINVSCGIIVLLVVKLFFIIHLCTGVLESSVHCDFESAFKCGYNSTVLGSLSWQRTNSASISKKSTGPTADIEGSTTGRQFYVLFIHHHHHHHHHHHFL